MKNSKNKVDLIYKEVEKNGKFLDCNDVVFLIRNLTEEQKKELVISFDDWNCERPLMRVLGKSWFAEYIASEYEYYYQRKDALHNFVNNDNISELFDEYPELEKIGTWVTLDKASYDKHLGLVLHFNYGEGELE